MSHDAPVFRPPFWLRGAHAQTLAPFLWHRRVRLPWRHERLELPDGDFVDLAHIDGLTGPRVCLFHGLEGNIDSHYIGGLAHALVLRGMPVTLMHMRGCSGEPNRLPRAYHSGDTGDMRVLFDRLRDGQARFDVEELVTVTNLSDAKIYEAMGYLVRKHDYVSNVGAGEWEIELPEE